MALKAFLILVFDVNASFLLATLKPVSFYCWNSLLSHSSVGAGALEVGLVVGPGIGLVVGPWIGLVVGPGVGIIVAGVGLVGTWHVTLTQCFANGVIASKVTTSRVRIAVHTRPLFKTAL